MIDLYSWATPNGRKVSIMLEETGLEYELHPINIGKGDQKDPEFLKISPNGKIPAIVDRDNGLALMESGAILLYLAEKSGQLAPQGENERWDMMQWLMFQMGGIGPMFGQTHHFLHFNAGKAPYADERYHKETMRLYAVLDGRLAGRDFILDDYSIVDIATWPWFARWEWHQIDWDLYPNVKRWLAAVAARPAVQRGYNIPESQQKITLP